MVLNPSNSSNLEQLALKGLMTFVLEHTKNCTAFIIILNGKNGTT